MLLLLLTLNGKRIHLHLEGAGEKWSGVEFGRSSGNMSRSCGPHRLVF